MPSDEERKRLRDEVEAKARADVERAMRALETGAGVEFAAPVAKKEPEDAAARLARSAREYEEMGYAVVWSADRRSFTGKPPANLAAFGEVTVDADSV